MDIYDYLKMDHKKVSKLFELFESAKNEKNKWETFEMIKEELTLHADAEEKIFYEALKQYSKSEEKAWHGEEEHAAIKKQLQEIRRLKKVSPTMEMKVLELKDMVEHHISDEEGKIFKIAKSIFDDNEALILKEKMHDLKEKMLHASKREMEEKV